MSAQPAASRPSTDVDSPTVLATRVSLPPLDDQSFRALVDDVRERGVLVPVEVADDGEVLDGVHRLRALHELGITTYPRVVRAGLTEDERISHRLAVNTHRRHLNAAQRREAVKALREATGWSTRRLSAATKVPQSTVARILSSVPESGSDDPNATPVTTRRVAGADGKTYPARRQQRPTSVWANTRGEEVRAKAALTALGDVAPGRPLDLRRAERMVREQTSHERRLAARHIARVTSPNALATVHHVDIRDLAIEPGTVDLLLTDPPYTAADTSEAFNVLAKRATVWLRPGGLLVAYCGQMHLPQAITALGASALEYWWLMAALHDTATGVGQVRQRAIGCTWKPLLVFRQPGGDGLPPWSLDRVNGTGRAKGSGHIWEQGQDEAEQIILALTQPGDLVVDPYGGSGTVAAAAVTTARRVITGDRDPLAVQMTRDRLSGL